MVGFHVAPTWYERAEAGHRYLQSWSAEWVPSTLRWVDRERIYYRTEDSTIGINFAEIIISGFFAFILSSVVLCYTRADATSQYGLSQIIGIEDDIEAESAANKADAQVEMQEADATSQYGLSQIIGIEDDTEAESAANKADAQVEMQELDETPTATGGAELTTTNAARRQQRAALLAPDNARGAITDRVRREAHLWVLLRDRIPMPPRNMLAFAVLISNGAHVALLLVVELCLLWVGLQFKSHRSAVLPGLFILLHMWTQLVPGALTGRWYMESIWSPSRVNRRGHNVRRAQYIVGTTTVVPLILLLGVIIQNVVAASHQGALIVPWGWIAGAFAVYYTLALGGSAMGFSLALRSRPFRPLRFYVEWKSPEEEQAFLRMHVVPGWRTRRVLVSLMMNAGAFILVLSTLYYVIQSVWLHRYYMLFGFLFCTLVLWYYITACFAIVFVFMNLRRGDPRWHWIAWWHGASTGVFFAAFFAAFWWFELAGHQTAGATLLYTTYTLIASCLLGAAQGAVCVYAARAFLRRAVQWHKQD